MNSLTRPVLLFFASVLLYSVALSDATASVQFGGVPHISDVTLLLPYTSESEIVSRPLSAYNGCFRWSCSNPALLHMELGPRDKNGCINTVYVSSAPITVSPEKPAKRQSAVIIADDATTGKSLRCDVFVDNVVSVEMKTRTRTINKGDEELVQVQARDSLGNTFSTLEGMSFVWTLSPVPGAAPSSLPVLKFVRLADSTVAVSSKLKEIESRGLRGSAVLVQGLDIGEMMVSAKLQSHGSAIAPAVARMAVLQPLDLEPVSPLYLAPETTFQYELYTRKKDLRQRVSVPDPRYKWSSSAPKIASVKNDGTIYTKELGAAQISVAFGVEGSKDVPAGGAARMVYVVEPASLAIRITPADPKTPEPFKSADTRVLVGGVAYNFDILVYDAEQHLIDVTDNMRFSLEFDKEILSKAGEPAENGVRHILSGVSRRVSTAVTASLLSISGRQLPTPLQTTQDVLLTEPVSLLPEEVVLPWVPHVVPHQYHLTASGGSGDYKWSVADQLIASVSPAGVVTALARGETIIVVSDARNEINSARSILRVAEPASLSFAPHQPEVSCGTSVAVELVASDSEGHPFANCSSLPFVWSLYSDPESESLPQDASNAVFYFQNNESIVPKHPDACVARLLHARIEGQSRLSASLAASNGASRAETRLFAFAPLTVVSPHLPAPVTLGASATYHVTGGPAPWYLDPSAFRENATPTVPSSVDIVTRGSAHRGQFTALCLEYGNQTIAFSAGNQPRQTLLNPAHVKVDAQFTCSPPYMLLLRPLDSLYPGGRIESRNVPDSALGNEENDNGNWIRPNTNGDNNKINSVPEETKQNIVAAAAQYKGAKNSKNGHQPNPLCASMLGYFADDLMLLSEGAPLPVIYHLRYNQTLEIEAVLADKNGIPFYNSSTVVIDWTSFNPDNEKIAPIARWDGSNSTVRSLHILPSEGVARIRVSATSYIEEALVKAGISADRAHDIAFKSPLLTREIDLVLHENVAVSPAAVSIVNHPQNYLELEASHGSGNYIFRVDRPDLATIVHVAGSSTARLLPRRPGTVRVTVEDACLVNSAVAVSVVHIADVASLELSGSDLVQIGDTVTMDVIARDATGTAFDPSQYRFLDIKLDFDSRNLALVSTPAPGRFVLKGLAISASSVFASLITQEHVQVSSNPIQVHVFAPFVVTPSHINLIPGAYYRLRWTGGPPLRHEVTFRTENGDIAQVVPDSLGLIRANQTGLTRIIAQITAVHSVSHERVVFGNAFTTVSVQHLRGLRLRAATNRLVVAAAADPSSQNVACDDSEDITGEESVWIEGVGEGETPLTISGVGLRFSWTAADPHVVGLHSAYDTEGFSLEDEQGAFGAHLIARAPGQTSVSVSVSHVPPHLPPSIYSTLSASLHMSVVESLRVLTPHRLLLPPHSRFTIRTNKDGSLRLRYSVLRSGDATPVLNVTSSGVIDTLAAFGTAVVLIQDLDTAMSVAVHVSVKPVSQLQLVPVDPSKREIPVGSSASFRVVLRDDLGSKFHALPSGTKQTSSTSNPSQTSTTTASSSQDSSSVSEAASTSFPLIGFDTNFPDTITIDKLAEDSTVSIKALRPGQPVVRVFYEPNTAIEDYLRIYVGQMVEPLNPIVHVGGTVTFSTSTGSEKLPKGSKKGSSAWSSSNPSTVKIDGQSGVATATAVGTSTITYRGSIFASTDIRVAKISSIVIDDEGGRSPLVVTNAITKQKNGKNVRVSSSGQPISNRIHLRFLSSLGEDFSPALTRPANGDARAPSRPQINHNMKIDCSCTQRSWATARSVIDSATGEAYCEIMPTESGSSSIKMTPPEFLRLIVTAGDSAGTYNVEGTFKVKFLHRFEIEDIEKEGAIVLSQQHSHKQLSVRFATPSLTVTPLESNLLSVTAISSGVYDIDVQPAARSSEFQTEIELQDSATGQVVRVPVIYGTPRNIRPNPQQGGSNYYKGGQEGGNGMSRQFLENGGSKAVVLVCISFTLIVVCALVFACTGTTTSFNPGHVQGAPDPRSTDGSGGAFGAPTGTIFGPARRGAQ